MLHVSRSARDFRLRAQNFKRFSFSFSFSITSVRTTFNYTWCLHQKNVVTTNDHVASVELFLSTSKIKKNELKLNGKCFLIQKKRKIIQHVYKTYDRHRHWGKDTRDMRERGLYCVFVLCVFVQKWVFCLNITRGYFFDQHGFLLLKYLLTFFSYHGKEWQRKREWSSTLQRRHGIIFCLMFSNNNDVCRWTERKHSSDYG